MSTLHEHECTFLILPCWIIIWIINILDKSCRENQYLHCMFSNSPPPSEYRVFNEILWKNMVQPYRSQMTISCGTEKMRFACRVNKARIQTHTHNVSFLLLFHGSISYGNAPECYAHFLSCFPYVRTKMCIIFTLTEQKAPDNWEVHRLSQNATLLAPRIWNLLVDFWKILGPTLQS